MMQHEKRACWWPLEQPRYISFIIVTMSCYIIAISGQLASVISKRRFLFNHTNVFSRFWSFLVETDRAIWLFSYDVRSIDSYNYQASCNTKNAFNKVKRTLNGISCLVCIFYEKTRDKLGCQFRFPDLERSLKQKTQWSSRGQIPVFWIRTDHGKG